MNMENQQSILKSLQVLANSRQHRILISGVRGCGKTYLAHKYAQMLRISDFYQVSAVMADVKSIIDTCSDISNNVVLCIENLDAGMLQVSNPLLKFIEDCPENLYIVVTCRSTLLVPDTILSRCAQLSLNKPTSKDLAEYGMNYDQDAYNILRVKSIWKCVDNFHDVEDVLSMTSEQLVYFERLSSVVDFKGSVSSLTWKLQNYEDKTPTPIALVLKYIMQSVTSPAKKLSCLRCLDALDLSRMPQNAIITKFVFDNKYGLR